MSVLCLATLVSLGCDPDPATTSGAGSETTFDSTSAASSSTGHVTGSGTASDTGHDGPGDTTASEAGSGTADRTTTSDDSGSGASSSTTEAGGSSGPGGPGLCPDLAWQLDIPQIAAAEAVQVDATGTIYALGTHTVLGQTDAWVGAYDPMGHLHWGLSLDPGLFGMLDGDELGIDMGLHSSGDLLVLVQHPAAPHDVGVLRLDTNAQTVLWWSTLDAPAVDPMAPTLAPGKIAVSDADAIIVSGVSWGAPVIFADQWVARFAELDGAMQWVTGVSITDMQGVGPEALAVHDTEGIFSIAHYFLGGVASTTSSMARLSLDGVWSGNFTHPFAGPVAYVGRAVAFDQSDNLAVAYTEHSWQPDQGIQVERQEPNFNILSAGTSAVVDVWENPSDVVVDALDLAVVVGSQGPLGIQQGWIRVHDPAGMLVWDDTEAVLPDTDFRAVDVAPDGAYVVAGRNGSVGWLRRYGPCTP
ncbi:MAG: hypothetical protein K0V04_17930 [Deltaproteobacteria bacterium]|nr:hypothetical protein [Deltaproteobacteria bacterium]